MTGNAPIETTPDGDIGFRGVESRLHPSQVPAGLVAFARNMRFRNGVAETRPGTAKIGWTNNTSSSGISPWGTVYGWGVFSDPDSGVEYSIVAADGAVYYTRSHNFAAPVPLPSGVTITAAVEFEQCFDVLVMFRGVDLAPLVMSDIAVGFTAIEASPTGSGLLDIPNAAYGLSAANRLLVPTDSDGVWTSDILDYTRGSIYDDFRINQGSADSLVALATFGPSTLVCFKQNSVYAVSGFYGDLSAAQLSAVTKRFGITARKSVVDVGTDLLWLSPLGVASLRLTEQNEVQAGGGLGAQPMFSAPIQPLIDRINWIYADQAVGKFWENKYYLAVPLDEAEVLREEMVSQTMPWTFTTQVFDVTAGRTYRWVKGTSTSLANGASTYTRSTDFVAAGSTATLTFASSSTLTDSLKPLFKGVNNAVLVYDFENGAWSGYDTIAGVDFKDFKLLTYNSRQRLFTISSDGFVTLMEEGYEDQLAEPYMDFTFTAQPDHGEIFSVNGGTSITVSGVGFGVQDATQLGAGDMASARSNLWVDGDFTAGYYSAGGAWATWTAPNTKAVKITNGVRFYAANGIVPNGTYSSDGAGFSFERVTHIAILSEVQLRGYTNGAPLSRKAGQKLRLHLETWHPKYSVSLLNEGVREETVLDTDRERSRTKYDRPHTRADYVETNASNDFLTAGRQDYSIGYSATNMGFQLGTSGVVLGYHQEMQHGLTAPGRSRATQVKLTNSQGRIRLLAAGYAVGGTADKRKGVLV